MTMAVDISGVCDHEVGCGSTCILVSTQSCSILSGQGVGF